jgi:23S rRNA pseudouridine2605 synthase
LTFLSLGYTQCHLKHFNRREADMSDSKKLVRLQKFIASCGVTSRRKAEVLITDGKVSINGKVITELGTKIDPSSDAVSIEGQFIDKNMVEKMYLVMNKPRGYVSTVSDPEGRKTLLDLCREISERIYPVGRLDYLSEGLIILTNDGDFAQSILHPSKKVTKVYEVKVFGIVNDNILKKLRDGATVDGQVLKPDSVRIVGQLPAKTWLEFRLTTGRNREIRKVCEEHGLTVDKLKRVAIGGLSVDGIKPGDSLMLSKEQILRKVGILGNENKQYMSNKKTVGLKKVNKESSFKKADDQALADDEKFHFLRRDQYFKSLSEIKIAKRKKLEEESKKA